MEAQGWKQSVTHVTPPGVTPTATLLTAASPPLRHHHNALAGAAQAVSATAVGYPFDFVKAQAQTRGVSTRAVIRDTMRGGLRGFYRGVAAPLASHLVKRPPQFAVTEAAKAVVGESTTANYAIGFVTGGVAGALGTPFQVVKVGMQTSGTAQFPTAGAYVRHLWGRNPTAAARLRIMWRGAGVCMSKDAIFGCAFVGTYYTLRDKTRTWTWPPPLILHGLNGAAAHCISWFVLIPIDHVKTHFLHASSPPASLADHLRVTIHTGGVGAMWRGVVPMCARTLPMSFVALSVYELVRDLLR